MQKSGPLTGMVGLGLMVGVASVTFDTAATGVILAALSTPHVNPPPQETGDETSPTSPTAFFVEMVWADNLPHDVDLHVRCLSVVDGVVRRPITVNYLQIRSGWLFLSRDDQGKPSVKNQEKVESNTEAPVVPPHTLCTVNAHLYHSHGGTLPVAGKVLAIADRDGPREQIIGSVDFVLREPGEEITVLVIPWDMHGDVIHDHVERYPTTRLDRIATAQVRR